MNKFENIQEKKALKWILGKHFFWIEVHLYKREEQQNRDKDKYKSTKDRININVNTNVNMNGNKIKSNFASDRNKKLVNRKQEIR